MATYLDEIKNETLYRRKFFLPINEEDKRHNSLIFLLSNSFMSSYELRNNPFALNMNRSFMSYYMEPNVKYYMNIQENTLTSQFQYIDLIDESADILDDNLITESTDDKNYGLPELKKYPMPDVQHVKSAIKFFNYVDKEHEEQLASAIKKNIKKFGIENINVGVKNRFSKYTKGMKQVTIVESSINEFTGDVKIVDLDESIADKYGLFIPRFVDNPTGKVLLFPISSDYNEYRVAAYYVVDEDTIVHMQCNYADSPMMLLDLLEWTLLADDNKVKYCLPNNDEVISLIKARGFEDYDGTLYKFSKQALMDSKKDGSYYLWDISYDRDIQSIKLDRSTTKSLDDYFVSEDSVIIPNCESDNIIDEASNYNSRLKVMLYKDRIRSNKEALRIFKTTKENDKKIQKTFLNIDRYKGLNLFVDLYYYNELFLKNVNLLPLKANDMYFNFLLNLLTDKRYDKDYKVKTVFIPVKISEYANMIKPNSYAWDYHSNINILSAFAKMIKQKDSSLKRLDGYTLVFIGNAGYFKTDKISELQYPKFITLTKKLYNKDIIADIDENKDSPKAIKTQIINTIEITKSVEINNLLGKTASKNELQPSKITTSADVEEVKPEEIKKKRLEKDKQEIVKVIDQYAKTADNTDDAIKNLDNTEIDSEYFKEVLKDLENSSNNNIKIDATRAARMSDINNKFLKKTVEKTSVADLIAKASVNTELPTTSLDIDTVNEEWKNLQGANFEKVYDIEEDIYAILYSLKDKSYPISILDVKKEDTSTSEDHVFTYTVNCEDSFGSRFTLKFDLPKFRNNRFMRLKGNEKTINGQLLLLPIIKTDEGTVQIVTSYKKIFIRRYGESTGKAMPQSDALMKALDKYQGKFIKVINGDNRRISSMYELPIDYLDLSKVYSKITAERPGRDKYEFYFSQKELREKYEIDDTQGIPYGVMNNKNVLYYNGQGVLSGIITAALSTVDSEFANLVEDASRRKKYTYSRASILGVKIPLIVVMAYNEGLTRALNKAKVEYELSEKRPRIGGDHDLIKFKDGYLKYRVEYDSSLLLNGLKECDTENYSLKEINSKEMWVDFLDMFGGRLKADGLDNFYDLTMDPITVDICKIYGLPTDYIEVLAYANYLLSDNKYNKHVDITGNRYRTNEQIAAILYEGICESYEQYKLQIKHNVRKPSMSMKQSVVIDKLMAQPTFSDLSVFSPLLEYEAANAVSFKGKSGMNSDRSYGLDKRIYDKSMTNVLALSTGFAANVGLTRQTTIDKNISGKRGLIKQSTPEDMNTTKALCMTEALTPFGTTHDDPFRTAMTFIQSSKHSMRTKKQSPLLITNGADEALPYLCSDMFAYKAKENGKVTEITKDYMKITYADGAQDFIDLRENIKKNSDGGVFEILKLDTDLKVGDKIKQGQIIAYDKKSFVTNTGSGNLATSVGVLSKVAVLETDEK